MNKQQEFRTYFETDDRFRDHLLSDMLNTYKINLLKFEDWLETEHGYAKYANGSMSAFLRQKFGAEAHDFIESIL